MSPWSRGLRLLVALLSLGAALAILDRAGLPQRGDTSGLPGGSRVTAPEVGWHAPAFGLPSLSSGRLTLEQARGSFTILNFWATWCQPCEREMRDLQRLYDASAGALRILALNQGEGLQVALEWAERLGLTYDVLLDERGFASRLYQIRGLPTTYMLDEAHVIRRVYFGAVSQERLRSDLALLAARA